MDTQSCWNGEKTHGCLTGYILRAKSLELEIKDPWLLIWIDTKGRVDGIGQKDSWLLDWLWILREESLELEK